MIDIWNIIEKSSKVTTKLPVMHVGLIDRAGLTRRQGEVIICRSTHLRCDNFDISIAVSQNVKSN